MKIKLDPGAYMPERAHPTDAGLDLRSPVELMLWGGQYADIDTGVHIQLPPCLAGFVKSKSGLMFRNDILTDGVVDEGYTGSIHVKLFNFGNEGLHISKGDKIAQLVLIPVPKPELELVSTLEDTDRGTDGFGSTGR